MKPWEQREMELYNLLRGEWGDEVKKQYPFAYHPKGGHANKRFHTDFALPQWKIAIELDGNSHDPEDKRMTDETRRIAIEDAGWTLRRFTPRDLSNPEKIKVRIRKAIEKSGIANNSRITYYGGIQKLPEKRPDAGYRPKKELGALSLIFAVLLVIFAVFWITIITMTGVRVVNMQYGFAHLTFIDGIVVLLTWLFLNIPAFIALIGARKLFLR